jgi:dTDP-4-amino-4,6-dideoxygalactose transaminase
MSVAAPAAILQTSPLAGYLARQGEIDAAIAGVLRGGRFLLGPETAAFEAEFAAYTGVPHCVGASSGTEALHLALAACGIGRGDEVITVSHTAVATVAAIDLCGAQPVLVDIERESFALNPALLPGALTARTRSVVLVHLYGRPAPVAEVSAFCRAHGLRLIEDCAQAHGARIGAARVGSFGDVSAFSFYPTKNLGALGDGGAVLTRDAGIAERLAALRQYGWRQQRYVSEMAGWNARLDELQAAVLRVKLRGLDEDNDRRRAIAAIYRERLAGIPGLTLPGAGAPGEECVYHQYVIRCGSRDALADYLQARNIQTLIHYPAPIHRQPAYAARGLTPGPLPETERAAREVLSLPIYPELPFSDAQAVASAIREFFGR